MIKNIIHFEVSKEDRKYTFFCDPSAPLGEIHDVLCMMKNQIIQQITEAQKRENEAKQAGN